MKYLAAVVIAVPLGLAAFLLQPGSGGFTTTVIQIRDPLYIAAGFLGLAMFAAALSLISVGRLRNLQRHQG